jgi:bifunctional DNA-binding transcriptional regulator/antitoxin component of YhaV-PrlF toxin-antitoxin module
VLSGKRITIPDPLSKKYNIQEGDIVIVEDDHGIRIVPVEVRRRET